MASSAPPPPPPPHNNGGRGQGCARGWNQLRHLQVRSPRRPHSGLNAEGIMQNQNNPGRYRGGGAHVEFVRGGMGRGRRPNYFVNRGGRGPGVQNRHSLGAMPDCVPQSGFIHHAIPDEQPQPQQLQEEHSGIPHHGIPDKRPQTQQMQDENSGNPSGEVNINQVPLQTPENDIAGVTGQHLVQPSHPITQARGVPYYPPMNEIREGPHIASPAPPLQLLPTVSVLHTGQHSTNPMTPIPLVQTVSTTSGVIHCHPRAIVNERTAYVVGPVLPQEQNAQHVPTTAFTLAAFSHMFVSTTVCSPGILPDPILVSDMTQGIIPSVAPTRTTDVTYSEPDVTEVQKILEHSTLSPNAKEFIPSTKQVPSQLSRSSGTDRNEIETHPSYLMNTQADSVSSSNVKENSDFMAASNGAYGCQEKSDDDLLENWTYTEMVETLQLVQFELIKHPANFNNMMKNIINPTLFKWLQSNLAGPMVEFIIGMATHQDNFGYIAARMCVYVSNLDSSNVFRTSLIDRCHAMCQNIGEDKKSTTFLGFVMFLAELYVQFINEKGQRVNVIGTGLLECLENLISEPVVCDNLKFFCNALKLAGYYLDADLKSAMNQLMTHIQSVMTAVGLDNMDKRIYNQLQKLIDMRNNNWDNQGAVSLESQELDGTNNSVSATFYSDAVFYGPDGQVLTLEESQFLTENQSLADCSQNEYDEDSCKEDSNDSMDEEMQDAYEQFLQMVPEAR